MRKFNIFFYVGIIKEFTHFYCEEGFETEDSVAAVAKATELKKSYEEKLKLSYGEEVKFRVVEVKE